MAEKNLFVQFYAHYPNKRYELFNGFSDTWDFCKSKGEMVWIPWEFESSGDFFSMPEDRIPNINIPFSEGNVYVSCLFSYNIKAVYKWASQYPNINFILGGAAILEKEFELLPNMKIFKGSVEECFGIENYSYEWKIELPEELKNIDIELLRYVYKIGTACYWGKCTFCRLPKDGKSIRRRRKKPNLKTKFNKISNAKKEIIVATIPSITKELIRDFLLPLELDDNMSLKTYIRPDKESYMACKFFFRFIKHLDRITFSTAPEFISSHMLNVMDKGTTVKYILKFLDLCKKYNVNTQLNFIIGWPELEERDVIDLEKNISMIDRSTPLNLFMLRSIKDHTILGNEIHPPSSDKISWFPITKCSDDVIKLNIKAMNILKKHFYNLIAHHNFYERCMDDILLNRNVKRKINMKK